MEGDAVTSPYPAWQDAVAPLRRDALAPDPLDDATFVVARDLIATRRHVSPRRLVEPGPTCAQLEAMLTLAAAAPDHGLLTP
ncbi:MAG: hypothetical protein HXY24_01535, partial [Rubrivivax sp.]|nr:hypothetical protein [Rubrivivax sp.]